MSLQRPKIAIIGGGFMGQGVFWQSRINGLYDCVAVCDIKPDKFISFAGQRGSSTPKSIPSRKCGVRWHPALWLYAVT